MGRSKPRGTISPIMPTENVGMVSGPIRKRSRGRFRDKRGSRRGGSIAQVTMRDPKTGKLYGGLVKDGVPQFKAPDGSTPRSFPKDIDISKIPVSRRIPREFDSSKPSAVMETERVNVEDPTLGGPPEREVPIPRERRQRISRRSDPRGRAPFSPDERGMARDRFFEKMFERSDERRQQRSMEREERDNVRDSLRSERGLRGSENAGPGDERAGEGRRRRRGGGRRRRRGRRRDFTRRRSRMEGGRRGRSGREMAAFRDQYVSTLR